MFEIQILKKKMETHEKKTHFEQDKLKDAQTKSWEAHKLAN